MIIGEQSLIDRLEVILGELECHYHYLLNDVHLGGGSEFKDARLVLDRLGLAARCVSAAVRAMRDEPVAALVEEVAA